MMPLYFKIPQCKPKALFCYLFFKSCHGFFVLLLQRVGLMLQSFLLVWNSNSVSKVLSESKLYIKYFEKRLAYCDIYLTINMQYLLLNISRMTQLTKKPRRLKNCIFLAGNCLFGNSFSSLLTGNNSSLWNTDLLLGLLWAAPTHLISLRNNPHPLPAQDRTLTLVQVVTTEF